MFGRPLLDDNEVKVSMVAYNTKALIKVSNDDDTMDLVTYSELPANFEEICKENNSSDIIEVNPDILVTELNEFKENLVGVWVSSYDDTDAKSYLEFYKVVETDTYKIISMNLKDNGEINEVDQQIISTISEYENNNNFFELKNDSNRNIVELSMANNDGVYTLLGVGGPWTKCNSGECFSPRALSDLNTFLQSEAWVRSLKFVLWEPWGHGEEHDSKKGDAGGNVTVTRCVSGCKIHGPNDFEESEYEYTIEFYKDDNTKFVLSFNNEKYVIKQNGEQLETQELDDSDEIINGTTDIWDPDPF